MNPIESKEWLQRYYGEILSQSSDLKTNACCATGAPPARVQAALANVHDDVSARFYGCGFPIPDAIDGLTVVDLGCGTGRDVFVLAQLVGESGRVIGVDMTPSQLAVARETEAWHAERFGYAAPNTRFVEGFIEDLAACGIADGSVDVVVSNCVVNLSPDKERVLREVVRVLKPGGEFYLSDVVVDRRLPDDVAHDPVLHAECLGGAMYRRDFEALARRVGFGDPRAITSGVIDIHNADLQARVRDAGFASVTWRMLKLAGLEPECEDYGQTAVYAGGMAGCEEEFVLDESHRFPAGAAVRVSGNTAMMLTQTRFAPWFTATGDRAVHAGAFVASPAPATATASETSSCCPPKPRSSCC